MLKLKCVSAILVRGHHWDYMEKYQFENRLLEGVIELRRGQFTMVVNINGTRTSCHCPTTGRIGNLDVTGRPCLLSKSADPKRKTPYTVEAISLDRPEDSNKSWIGINQNAANRYVEHYLKNGGFADMVGMDNLARRELLLRPCKKGA